jgi:hypothetical protein
VAPSTRLACVVDDAQWLDRASVQCLAFAARRLLAEPIALIFAVRGPGDDQELAGLPGLTVTRLGNADARTLLASAVGGRVDAEVRDRIVAETRGNPLALLQLAAAASLVEEVQVATEATGSSRLAPYGALGLAALRGREAEASALANATKEEVMLRGEGIAIGITHWATAALGNGLGHYGRAPAAAGQASAHPADVASVSWGLVELAVRCCHAWASR